MTCVLGTQYESSLEGCARARECELPQLLGRRVLDLWPLATEMMFEIVSAAGVRLVAICEIASALLTLP